MIKITALNKFYKSKRRSICHALKNISLTLPDAGLVFVLGKSGSGKSTLLNLIGGLDNISSGSIEVDGNDLAGFKEKDFCNYRNTHIGFIFQDYHLIDELTVYENIVLSLNLRRIEDRDLVKAALAKVDLAGYEDRYPTELSGGEQQRVAIARAIVKNPRIILADEPTGNLDTHTSTAIITLLKQLSKECLILIVSHNVNDANNYADRIIELAKGEIISDKSRNPEFADQMTLKNGELVYPKGLALSDSDIELINKNKGADFVKRNDKFLATQTINIKTEKRKIENKRLSIGKELSLSGKFLKNKSFAISLSAFMVAVIMTILAMAQTISAFDGGHIIADEMKKSNQTSVLLDKVLDAETKAQLSSSYHVKVDDGDIESFYDAGYNGKIYPIINYTLPITNMYTYYGTGNTRFYNGVFLASCFGTMIVDEEFLAGKFGENYEYLATADTMIDHGLIITDYAADSLIAFNSKYKGKSYEDIVGALFLPGYTDPRIYINAIIKTDYKEKYGELLNDVMTGKIKASDIHSNTEIQAFFTDVYNRLGYSYTTSQNFVNSYVNSGMALHPGHYKLTINGITMDRGNAPYIVGYNANDLQNENSGMIMSNWYYTTQIPEIPEGAKYIRVAFNDGFDDMYKIYNGVTELDGAKLSINGVPVSQDVINYHRSTREAGFALDMCNGELIDAPEGKQFAIVSDYIELPEGCEITEYATIAYLHRAFCAFYDEDKNFISADVAFSGVDLNEGEIVLNYTEYNSLFQTNYTPETLDQFLPHTAVLAHYEYGDLNNENPHFVKEVKIAGLTTRTLLFTSPDIHALFLEDFIRVQSLYFDGTDGIGSVIDLTEEMNYEMQSYSVEGIHSMTRVVDIFVPIFDFLSIFLYVGVIFILMSFSTKMISDKMHEIGILKALGTKNSAVVVVFGLQVLLIALLTCGLSTLGYYLFIDVANDILIESVKRIAPSWVMPDLQFLTYKADIALDNCALTFILALASLVAPMIKIKAIKPVKIIKAKE